MTTQNPQSAPARRGVAASRGSGPFTGWHMLAICVAFFGVVIAVNVVMADLAISTFSGEVVENSYVASQRFNGWLDEAKAEQALGWKATAGRTADGRIAVRLQGAPADAVVTGAAWHPLGRQPDRTLSFVAAPGSGFISRETVPSGRWTIRLEVTAGGHRWRAEQPIA